MADIIKDAEREFTDAQEVHSENRSNALDDLKFGRLGEQWDEKDMAARKREGRPCLTINKLPAFIRQVTNEARMNRPSIKVKPVDDDGDPETADILNGIIRNIEYSSNADTAYETALEYAVSAAFGFFEIRTEYAHDDAFNQDIRIKRIHNPFAIEWDPYGEEPDGSDWEYAFKVDWLTETAFKRRFGKKDMASFCADLAGDKNKSIRDDMVRIAKYWKVKEEQKTLLMFNDGTVMLEDDATKPHPDTGVPVLQMFQDMGINVVKTRKTPHRTVTSYILGGDVLEEQKWPGKWIPIVPVFGEELNVEGDVILRSLVRDARDPQKMFNYWRTASTELVALAPKAPFIGPKNAFNSDIDKWSTANAISHAFIEYDGNVPPQRQGFSGVPAGALQEALNASDDMKAIMGIYDASLGARSNETSGKAIMARQREGDVGTFHFIDNLARSIRHGGRILVDLIPKVYDQPQVMRIIGVDGSPETVKINQGFMDEKTNTIKIHDLTAGKYDVAVDTGPSFTTRREEFVNGVTEIIRANPQTAPLLMDLVAKNLDWPEADEVAKRFKAMLPPQILALEDGQQGIPPEAQMMISQAQQQAQQMQQQMQAMGADLQKLSQENQTLKLQVQNKQGELQIAAGELQLKAHEIDAKAGSDQAKSQADVIVAEIEAKSAEKIAAMETSVQQMANRLEMIQATMSAREPVSVNVGGPRKKTVAIQSPSGQTYTGVIEEEADDNG